MNGWYEQPGADALFAGPPANPDRYTLDEIVSQGMEGRLWRSSLSVDGHRFRVAVKEIHQRNVSSLDEWLERWQRQAELLRSLDHPGLIRVREVFQGSPAHRRDAASVEERSLFLVMNWANGRPLDDWARTHGPQERLEVLAQIAGAVDHLHSGTDTNGVAVLHRDIKPQNVIVDDDGRPRLVDFGFARLADGTDYTIVGSANYMAPEIPLGSVPTPGSDRYSFGCVAYTVLSGHRVDPADRPGIRRNVDALRSGGLSDVLADHLQRLLSPDLGDRPTDLGPWSDAVASSDDVAPRDRTVIRPEGWWPAGSDPAAAPVGPTISTPPVLPISGTTAYPTTYPPAAPASWPPAHLTSFEPRQPTLDPLTSRGTTLPPLVAEATGRHWSLTVGIGLAVAALLIGVVAAAIWIVDPAAVDGKRSGSTSASTSTSTSTTTSTTAAPVGVPNVVGQTRSTAASMLAAQRLTVAVEYVESPTPGEQVLAADPPVGAQVASGAVVHLKVSNPAFTMPDLNRRTLDAAQTMLGGAGLLAGRLNVQPSGAPANSVVLGQAPGPGTSQRKDAPVTLLVQVPAPPTVTTTTSLPAGTLPLPPPTSAP